MMYSTANGVLEALPYDDIRDEVLMQGNKLSLNVTQHSQHSVLYAMSFSVHSALDVA
jgi:hypothetical protein